MLIVRRQGMLVMLSIYSSTPSEYACRMGPALSSGNYDKAVQIGAADLGLALAQQAAVDYKKTTWNGWYPRLVCLCCSFMSVMSGFVLCTFLQSK